MTGRLESCNRKPECITVSALYTDAFRHHAVVAAIHGPVVPDTVEALIDDSLAGPDRRSEIIQESYRLRQELLGRLPVAAELCEDDCPINQFRRMYGPQSHT